MKKLEEYLKKNSKTHLIFDFDETLIKLLLPWEQWFKDVAGPILKIDASLAGKSYSQIQNDLVKRQGPSALKLLRKLNLEFETTYLKGFEKNQELLDFIHNNSQFSYLIWSSNAERTVVNVLHDLGLDSVFKRIATRTNVTQLKPHTEGFKIIYDSRIPKEKYLFLGDSVWDEKAAKKLGIDFFKIDYFKQ